MVKKNDDSTIGITPALANIMTNEKKPTNQTKPSNKIDSVNQIKASKKSKLTKNTKKSTIQEQTTNTQKTKSQKETLKQEIIKEEKEVSTFIKAKHINYLFLIIGILVIGYILYLNFLPFGYHDEQTLDIGSPSDTSGNFYIEENSSLGPRQELNGEYFRVLDGVTNIVYKPMGVLHDANVHLELIGENVYFIQAPELPTTWDYDFLGSDFSKFEVQAPYSIYEQLLEGELVKTIDYSKPFAIQKSFVADLENFLVSGDLSLTQNAKTIILDYNGFKLTRDLGDYSMGSEQTIFLAYAQKQVYLFVNDDFVGKLDVNKITNLVFEHDERTKLFMATYAKEEIVKDEQGCYNFDGKTRLILPNTEDEFESGPFTVAVEWTPTKQLYNQQLIGHYNWEILQNSNNIEFRVGRMYNNGPAYSIFYSINESFLNKKHSLIAIYSPSIDVNEQGYVELFVDNYFAGKMMFGQETIWSGYGNEKLSLGWTPHNYQTAPYFKGVICTINLTNFSLKSNAVDELDYFNLNFNNVVIEEIKNPIFGNGKLTSAKIFVSD